MVVIDYPGLRIRDRIRALQLEWMMDPRDASLHVQDRYWKGLTVKDLDLFLPPEARP